MYEGMNTENLVRLRVVISKLSRTLNAAATDEGLTPTQASVLGIVTLRGPMGLSELADLDGLNPTMLSRVVRFLSDEGLVKRLTDDSDLRAAKVQATEEGHDLAERIRTLRTGSVAACLERMPNSSVKAITEALPALEDLTAELRRARRHSGAVGE